MTGELQNDRNNFIKVDEPTCCPEDEVIPCSACAHSHTVKHGLTSNESESQKQELVELTYDHAVSDAPSLTRLVPPEIPHGHAAAPEADVRNSSAKGRDIPAPDNNESSKLSEAAVTTHTVFDNENAAPLSNESIDHYPQTVQGKLRTSSEYVTPFDGPSLPEAAPNPGNQSADLSQHNSPNQIAGPYSMESIAAAIQHMSIKQQMLQPFNGMPLAAMTPGNFPMQHSMFPMMPLYSQPDYNNLAALMQFQQFSAQNMPPVQQYFQQPRAMPVMDPSMLCQFPAQPKTFQVENMPLAASIPFDSKSSSSIKRQFESDKAGATWKTEVCRSYACTGQCEYGTNCQFAHGLDELHAREIDGRFKTEKCSNYHNTSTCSYGSRCKFIHDEYRVRVSEVEFWLISPRDRMVRVERVDKNNFNRLQQLCTLIDDQCPTSILAATQLNQLISQDTSPSVDASHPAVNGAAAASAVLRSMVNPPGPDSVAVVDAFSHKMNVQAMQVGSNIASDGNQTPHMQSQYQVPSNESKQFQQQAFHQQNQLNRMNLNQNRNVQQNRFNRPSNQAHNTLPFAPPMEWNSNLSALTGLLSAQVLSNLIQLQQQQPSPMMYGPAGTAFASNDAGRKRRRCRKKKKKQDTQSRSSEDQDQVDNVNTLRNSEEDEESITEA